MFLPSNITLKFGDSGDFVAELQRRLARVHCFNENEVNGMFDGTTHNAVTSFQAREGLHADGVAGPETLRRLNGVIAGDTSGASDTKKEEEVRAESVGIAQEIFAQPAAAPDPFAMAAPEAAPEQPAYSPPAAAQPAPVAPPPEHQPYVPATPDPQRIAELAALQQQAQPQPFTPAPPQQQPFANAPHPTELAAQFAPPQPQQPPQPAQAAALDPQAAAQAQAQQAPQAEQQPRGIVGKAVQFANSVMQRMADYFEAKLPPSVLKEVQHIGQVMAASGMKENPIPTGPEMPARSQELPSRGPEASQVR